MQTGTVKYFNHSKGFGFIKAEDTGKEIFFHISKILEDIFEDEKVTFELQESTKGLNAINVRPA
jgi:cold shock protein